MNFIIIGVVFLQAIWEIIKDTPTWVWVLFGYLVYVGINATRSRTVYLPKIFIVPTIFVVMTWHTVVTKFSINYLTILVLVGALLIGYGFGWSLVSRHEVKFDRQQLLIQISGTWSVLLIILIMFCSKYYFGFAMAMDPKIVEKLSFEFAFLAISGIGTGIFIGRSFGYLWKGLRTN
jgi:hypothetical protein